MPSLRSILRRRDSPWVMSPAGEGRARPHPSAIPVDVDGCSISLGGTGFGLTALCRSTWRRAGTRPLADCPLGWSAEGERTDDQPPRNEENPARAGLSHKRLKG